MMNKLIGFLIALAVLPGCATSGVFSKFSGGESIPRASAHDPAVRCLCVWQTAEGTDPQGRLCRGVAGQVFFFSRNSAVPVAVDGDVKVYVFDDQGTEEEQSKPMTQFDVDAATWNTQLTKTQFGPAYQIFVPYTRPGRHEARMAVRLRMSPTSGSPVFSDLTTIELTGPKSNSPKASPKVETAAKVEQAFRDQFADRQASASRIAADGQITHTASVDVIASNRHTGETIALIRRDRNTAAPAGGQFHVDAQEQAAIEDQSTTSHRLRLRSRTVAPDPISRHASDDWTTQ